MLYSVQSLMRSLRRYPLLKLLRKHGPSLLHRYPLLKLAATLRDTEPEDDSDNEDDGILNAFTVTVNPTEGIVEDVVEEEELVESKFEKMDDQDDIHTTYEKLYKLSEKYEKL